MSIDTDADPVIQFDIGTALPEVGDPKTGPFNVVSDIWFSADGTLYGVSPNGDLFTIDPDADSPTAGERTSLFNVKDPDTGTSLRLSGLTGENPVVEVPEVAIDHFKCYEAEGDDHLDVSVDLEDQFGFARAEVEEPELFCNPVDKNDEGIFDDTAHLTGYELDDDDEDFESLDVTVSNQFGEEQVLVIEEPELLLVPSIKNGVGVLSDLNLDHFKCYEVEDGDDVNLILPSLEDQFGFEQGALVKAPELFCNPVDKNNGGILDDTVHLTCYEIEARDADQDVYVINQLPDNQVLELEEAELLCVPSEKLAVVPHEDDDEDEEDDDDDDHDDDDDDDD